MAETIPEATTPKASKNAPAQKLKSTPITKELKRQADECREERAELILEWSESVDMHRGKPFAEDSDSDRIPINKDWPRVKARVSSLFGQMPEVRLKPKQDLFAPATPVFAKEVNDTLKRADADEAIYQALVDNTATAGIGVVVVAYHKRTDTVETPMIDMATVPPDVAAQLLMEKAIPMMDEEVTVDAKFSCTRRSPSDLLWPVDFTGFNFDHADWIGTSGEMGWPEAKVEFHLSDEDKEKVLGDGKETSDTLKQGEPTSHTPSRKVSFDEIFYWAYRFDPTEKYFKKIKRIVFVKGLEDPVIHEDWAGQQFDEASGTYVGACRFPIRVLKINYVSDDAIPPSESAIGRPQVLELIESRTDQHNQRKRNIPHIWINTGKVDPEVLVQLMQGTWQGVIPINGRGDDAIGALARSPYPPENQMFDRTVNHDLDEVWQSGANQSGSFASGERSASEARIVQSNFDMRNGLDRQHVAKFVQGIAEVMAGLIALYGEFEFTPPEDVQRMDESWDRTRIAAEFVYEVVPDSMVRLDAHQQIKLKMDILNMVGKSGFVNPAGLIRDILVLAGSDPAKDMTQPEKPPAEPLNISIRSAEDLHDPLMLALLMKTNQAPSPEELQAAKMLAAAAMTPIDGTNVPPPVTPEGPAPEAPPGTATAPEEMNVMDKIVKRSDYGS